MKKIIALAVLFGFSCAAHAEGMYATAGFGNQSDLGTGISISGGYQVSKVGNIPVAAEIGYQSFGSKDVSGVSVKAHAFYGAAVGVFDLGSKLTATGKLGFTSKSAEASYLGAKTTATDSGLLFGVGIEYEIQKNIAVGLEYVNYASDAVVGARVKFGF